MMDCSFFYLTCSFFNLIFFYKDQTAKTNAKMPRFCCNVNEPLQNYPKVLATLWAIMKNITFSVKPETG